MVDPEPIKLPSSAVSRELRATPGRGDDPPSTDDYPSMRFVLRVAEGLRMSDHHYEREHERAFEAAAL